MTGVQTCALPISDQVTMSRHQPGMTLLKNWIHGRCPFSGNKPHGQRWYRSGPYINQPPGKVAAPYHPEVPHPTKGKGLNQTRGSFCQHAVQSAAQEAHDPHPYDLLPLYHKVDAKALQAQNPAVNQWNRSRRARNRQATAKTMLTTAQCMRESLKMFPFHIISRRTLVNLRE